MLSHTFKLKDTNVFKGVLLHTSTTTVMAKSTSSICEQSAQGFKAHLEQSLRSLQYCFMRQLYRLALDNLAVGCTISASCLGPQEINL